MQEDILGLPFPVLQDKLAALQLPAYRAGQVFTWLHGKRVHSFAEMTNLSNNDRRLLTEQYCMPTLFAEQALRSDRDDTRKYLFRLADRETIESVVMQYKCGSSICISTQVGCKMHCAFCASGMHGFKRNLTAGEIVGQVYEAQRDFGQPITRLVLMGVGEPLDNYANVRDALHILTHPDGQNLGRRRISLSTSGIVPGIETLAHDFPQLTLSVSLHAPNDALRSEMMPVNRTYPLLAVLEACRKWSARTRRRITFEYALFDNVNDSDGTARELAALLKGMFAHVNLITGNEVEELGYRRSTPDRIRAFHQILADSGLTVTLRRTLGRDISGACGQLRSNRENLPRK
ncbi:MAG: 23S rRNA (adenine(2503)-C(2))-methyltransferase RlmN [Oscillospiraceae bacterium]|jgi:23S rRNA (adenine2503-C2)-methyltransferase|nr:23S rRNA (adenine(2503)-C(2))-methyltransferase RlmN [Oscillospiraceae bacterium]